MDNLKYVRIDNIYQRLTQRLKGREIPFEDIVEWCADCELNHIGQYTDWFWMPDVEFKKSDGGIINQQIVVPTDCWYIKSVKGYNNSRYVNFYTNGNFITLEDDLDSVWIDYYAFPTDSVTGYLIIPRGHEEACFWYCLKALSLQEYMDGRLDQNRWNVIENEFEQAVVKAVAASSRISTNDRVKTLDAMHTTFYNYKNPTRR
jgi:hypothetical protein